MEATADLMRMLEKTSRTFYLPIVRLPSGLREAVASGYLCMRAIDEIEDHPTLPKELKATLLRCISRVLQAQTRVETFAHKELARCFEPARQWLPEVTLRLGEWACAAPSAIAPRIWEATAAMADRMAHWASEDWSIRTVADLDRYTFGVAGAVGLMLADIFGWFEKIQIHRSVAIQFGRGLQAVNILRNREEDLKRGVDFFPRGWTREDLFAYARRNLDEFRRYMEGLAETHFAHFVWIPQALAYATLEALQNGRPKLTREEVLAIVAQAEGN